MNTAMRFEKAKDRAYAAEHNHRKLREERDQKIYDQVESLQEEVHAEYRDRMNAAHEECVAARAELDAAKLADAKPKWPVGTVVCAWKQRTEGWMQRPTGEWKVIAKGVMEIITAESEHPDSLNKYSRASIGDVVVRLLKKDGTPGKKYESLTGWKAKHWLPEGQTPGKVDEETGELLPA